jgi:ubiquinone/menaquinone biosynthesis C-methylase UbiE
MGQKEYFEKLIEGTNPEDRDWSDYLRKAHEAVPGMTPPVFGKYCTKEGLNSYQILAKTLDDLKNPVHVLDLACGDGFLLRYLLPKMDQNSSAVGVDMVPSEIALAQKNFPDPRAQFFCEMAQDLSLPASSVDIIMCHMVLMLMLPIEPVIKQLRRVLKTGGVLTAIVGAPRTPGPASAEIAQLIGQFLKENFPKMASPRTGDARFSSAEGLNELFSNQNGFSELKIEDFEIRLNGDMNNVWDFYKDMYLIGILPPSLKATLRQEMERLLQDRFDSTGSIIIPYPMRKFTVRAI